MEKYNFGYAAHPKETSVEIPELERFISAIQQVCETHGVSFELERGYGDSSTEMVLVPYGKGDLSFITHDLEHYRGGIAWLDSAKRQWEINRNASYARRKAAEEARAIESQRIYQEKVLREGIIVGGKAYRLIEG